MLYLGVPVRNEAPTIGVLLWRLRSVLLESAREFEVLVYDDGSTDTTADVLAPYTKVLPLTVLGGSTPVGYAAAVDQLLREAARRTRYPRRDAIILMQGDFTDQPEHIPELVRRFEGGADVVIAERTLDAAMPAAERRLRRIASWLLRARRATPETQDPFGTYRLIRLATVRDMVKARGDTPLLAASGWAANVELLVAARRFARRVEAVPLAPRYDLRARPSRRRPLADSVARWRAVLAMPRSGPRRAPA